MQLIKYILNIDKKLYECPICKKKLDTFKPFGVNPRDNAQCPNCRSLERHRLIYLFVKNKTNLFTSKLKMLHVAPERILALIFKNKSNIDYLSVDLEPDKAMVKMDITNIKYPDNTFDVIFASHVLEHIPDDKKAMGELYRVLHPKGWAILQVPIWGEKTFEDSSIKSPEEREKYFGQSDHVRKYGFDNVYLERLQEAGFKVKVDNYVKTLGSEKIKQYGLIETESIYYCKK